MKDKILEISKEELKATIDNMDMSNLVGSQSRINHIFNMLFNISELADMPTKKTAPDSEELEPIEIHADIVTAPPELVDDEEDVLEDEVYYEFERKLRGGMLKDLNIFVPEKTIRQLGIEDGDIVKATLISSGDSYSSDKYDYELIEKKAPSYRQSKIQEINMAIVHHDFSRDEYVVMEYMGKDGRTEIFIPGMDNPKEIVLQYNDVDKMNILDEDIVDIAYYENNPKSAKIRWVHPASHVERIIPKKSSYYKDSGDSDSEEIDQVLEDKTIVVVGGDSQWTAYREEVEALGGELITKGGSDSSESIENAVRSSDCLVNNIMQARHRSTGTAVEIAKLYNVPHTNVDNMGRTTFINAVKKAIGV